MYSIQKRAIWCSHFLDFPFDCFQSGDTSMQHTFALNVDEAGGGYRWFPWMGSVWQSLNLVINLISALPDAAGGGYRWFLWMASLWQSLNLAINLISTLPLPFLPNFQCFWEDVSTFGQNHGLLLVSTLRLWAGVTVSEILSTPALTPTAGKTVDSDQLQLRHRLWLRSPGFE